MNSELISASICLLSLYYQCVSIWWKRKMMSMWLCKTTERLEGSRDFCLFFVLFCFNLPHWLTTAWNMSFCFQKIGLWSVLQEHTFSKHEEKLETLSVAQERTNLQITDGFVFMSPPVWQFFCSLVLSSWG